MFSFFIRKYDAVKYGQEEMFSLMTSSLAHDFWKKYISKFNDIITRLFAHPFSQILSLMHFLQPFFNRL